MDTLRVRHLFQLVAADVEDWEAVAKDIATKFAERNLTAAKGFGAVAATILTSTVIPWSGSTNTQQDLAIGLTCAILTFLCGVLFFIRSRQYAAGLIDLIWLLSRLRSMRSVILRYGRF